MTEDALPGERLAAPGVGMKINVPRSCNIVGQVATGQTVYGDCRIFKVKIVNGRRYIWAPPGVGSNVAGRWVEDGATDAFHITRGTNEWLRKQQEPYTAGRP